MPGLLAVFRKELADNFSSKRFLFMFAIILLAGMSATYTAAQAIRAAVSSANAGSAPFVFLLLFTVSSGMLPSFISFISFLGALMGIALGFDAINGEYARGTLSRVLSHPIYRDSVINGKFLARLSTIAMMLICISLVLAGLGLRLIGVPPSGDEILRLLLYMVVSIVYVAFWMSLAILFSILFRQATTSALAGIGVWIFFTFFMGMIAGVAAQGLAPVNQQDPQTVIAQVNVAQAIARISPATLYQEITSIILDPSARTLSPLVMASEQQGMVAGILPLRQSILLVWPHIVALIAETVICFAASYVKFMRQEVRA